MKKLLTVTCGITLLFGACANNEAPNIDTKANPQGVAEDTKTTASDKLESTSKEAAEKKHLAAERLAKKRAQKHLALRQVSWGDPLTTTEDEDSFFFHYETPKRELRLIGQRTLIVKKESGLVSYRKRR